MTVWSNEHSWRGVASALALALGITACGQEPGAPITRLIDHPSSSSAPAWSGAATTVTLLTGDRVTLRKRKDGGLVAHVDPGPGRKHVVFSTQEHDGEMWILPDDALPLVSGGQLDRELFNVTRLIADGLADERTAELPLLITGAGELSGLRAQVASAGVSVTRVLPKVGVLAVRQQKGHASALLASLRDPSKSGAKAALAGAPPMKIWLDRKLEILLEHSVPQIGGPAARQRGLTGAGAVVAVLDGGIDTTHPDLAGKVIAAESFVPGESNEDRNGHGTHVASTIAGSGAASGGARAGVAPGASLLDGKVCDDFGCAESWILAGMEWAADQGADIVNMSLGGTDRAGIDPLEEAINRLSASHGTLFVVAAGNSGVRPGTVASPSSADAALSVGAVDRQDRRAAFSGQGPRVGDKALKPDLTAPGVNIVAARAAGTAMGVPVDDAYTAASGTSMATPHAAGAAALLRQQHPSWSGAQIKEALMSTAQPNPALTVYQQGAGRLDVDRATGQTAIAQPGSLNLGVAQYPHDDDAPITRNVRYVNRGGAPITLALSGALTALDGSPAPSGMLSIAPATLLVPAGGSAEASVTVDTRIESPNGTYGGALIATAGGARLVTPFGVEREHESYELTVNMIDSAGQPAGGDLTLYGVSAAGAPDRELQIVLHPIFGESTFRVPAGKYLLHSHHYSQPVRLVAPNLAVNADTSVVLDAALARPLALDVQVDGLSVHGGIVGFADRRTGSGAISLSFNGLLATGQVGPNPPPGSFLSYFDALFIEHATPSFDSYEIAHMVSDRFFTGWTQSYRDEDFAVVRARHAAQPGRMLSKFSAFLPPFAIGFAFGLDFPGAFERTERYHGVDLDWFRLSAEIIPDPSFPDSKLSIADVHAIDKYRPGHSYRETWNQAVFGPGFAGRTVFGLLRDRLGAPLRHEDSLVLAPTLFSDHTSPAREGFSVLEQGSLKLFRDGELLEETSSTESLGLWLISQIGAERATYRMEVEGSRSPELFELSTEVRAAWTFQEQAGTDVQILPLPTLRFSPALDQHNQTDARLMLLPVRIERPLASTTPSITDARVEASFDDGATWTRLPLLRFRDQALAVVLHPRNATHVSLRGSARDVAGRTVEQTVIRAYALKSR